MLRRFIPPFGSQASVPEQWPILRTIGHLSPAGTTVIFTGDSRFDLEQWGFTFLRIEGDYYIVSPPPGWTRTQNNHWVHFYFQNVEMMTMWIGNPSLPDHPFLHKKHV